MGHPIEEDQQHLRIFFFFFFFKTNLFKEWMKKFIILLMTEKQLGMNGRMSVFLWALCSMHKKLGQFFFCTYLLPSYTPNVIYNCILSNTCWKSSERACILQNRCSKKFAKFIKKTVLEPLFDKVAF